MPDITLQQLYNAAYSHAGDQQYFNASSNPTIVPEAQALVFINDSIRRHVRRAERGDWPPKIAKSQIDVVTADYSVQTITVTATGGTMTVSVTIGLTTYTTAALDYNVSGADMLTALQGIFPVGPDTVALDTGVYTVTWSAAPRPNIQALSVNATNLTGGTATVSSTDSGRGLQREYDLDSWLLDSSGDPQYRASLFVWRTDVTNPTPVFWPAAGDYRMKESYATWIGQRWPSQVVYEYVIADVEYGSRDIGSYLYAEVMYQRGRAIGFYEDPTEAMTLEAHYVPIIADLANATDTLGQTLGLAFLIDHRELLAVWAAIQMRQARNLQSSKLEGRYAVLLADFDEAVQECRPRVSPASTRRWRA